jgi:hypothetical protein
LAFVRSPGLDPCDGFAFRYRDPNATALRSPKIEISEAAKVLMGELRSKVPEPTSLNPKLEAALERWKRAAEGQGLLGLGQ